MSELLNFIVGQEEHFRSARLPSLYSDFTFQRFSNPDGFAANTSAWIDALTKAARAGLLPSDSAGHDTLLLKTGENLLRCLETKELGRPLALKTVIDEAVSQRCLAPYEDFVTTRNSIYSHRRIIKPWHLFNWGLKQLGFLDSSTGAGKLPTADFVLLRNVEEAASKIISNMGTQSNQIDRVYPMPMFRNEVRTILNLRRELTERDLGIILTYLERDKSKIIYDEEIVKFKVAGETITTLSTQDKTIASLKALIADINMQIALLSDRISSLSEVVQKAIDNKSRKSALAALRSKKLSEATLTQRSETLAQLEGVYSMIEQAADQVAIVHVMEASTQVLRNLNGQVGGIDKAEDIIAALRIETDKVDELGGAIEAGHGVDNNVDEECVDEELESLERRAKAKEEEKEARQTQKRLADVSGLLEIKGTQHEHRLNHQELSSDDKSSYLGLEEGIDS